MRESVGGAANTPRLAQWKLFPEKTVAAYGGTLAVPPRVTAEGTSKLLPPPPWFGGTSLSSALHSLFLYPMFHRGYMSKWVILDFIHLLALARVKY